MIENSRSHESGPTGPATAGYVSEVDALRCFAMTGVVALHAGLLPIGWAGVWVFYVISGFAISSSLLATDLTSISKRRLLLNFYAKRSLRIWPIYFLIVIPSLIAAAIAGRSDLLAKAPWLLTFTYNYSYMFKPPELASADASWDWVGHLWTISVEEQFYLIFPFLVAFLSRNRLIAALCICVALGPILREFLTLWLNQLPRDDAFKFSTVYLFAPAHFDAFATGALLALFRTYLSSHLRLARSLLWGSLCAAVVYTCVYLSINLTTLGFHREALQGVITLPLWGHGKQIWIYSVVVALAAAIIALILAGEGWLLKVCRLPLFRPIGRISYGGYVYHLPVLYLYDALWRSGNALSPVVYSLGKFAFGYPSTLLLAFLSFRYLEQPILKLRSRFSHDRQSVEHHDTAAAFPLISE
jgi:peptidoglycan/LPS O-acetylase OafA/YrhL